MGEKGVEYMLKNKVKTVEQKVFEIIATLFYQDRSISNSEKSKS